MTASPDAEPLVRAALAEDVGAGDWTTLWTVPTYTRGRAVVLAKAPGVIAGLPVTREVLRQVDSGLVILESVYDGDEVRPGDVALAITGSARSILSAERVMLNFLQRLSGIATLTNAYVRAVQGTSARILDTRKTTPGMRTMEKAAVVAGGGENHRFGLHDMILIKENHVAAAGGISHALDAVQAANDRKFEVEIEVRNLEELDEVLRYRIDRVLLDNFSISDLRTGVERVHGLGSGRPKVEASGGISLDTVGDVARTGVDFISVGALTHSAPALDLSLLLDLE
ncbi:MAG TPA: carboxylating nicotinate-nucleotide diphosphorylase [Longimicrobiaceae bacterium]|nr:carboxylating nicotinate-nucleotide diphosphorylase [Longimicrobiaceae bacterium]